MLKRALERAGSKRHSKAGGRDTNVIIFLHDSSMPATGQCFVSGQFHEDSGNLRSRRAKYLIGARRPDGRITSHWGRSESRMCLIDLIDDWSNQWRELCWGDASEPSPASANQSISYRLHLERL